MTISLTTSSINYDMMRMKIWEIQGYTGSVWLQIYTVRRKIFATEKFRELLPKRGGRNIRDKNIREGGSDTLRNTITWLLCLCGSLDL